MTSFIIIALAVMFCGMVWTSIEYWTEIVKPVNREILHHKFYDRADKLHRKIIDARKFSDCRRIQSNLITFQAVYGGIVQPRILDPVVKKLWGELDCRVRLIIHQREERLKPPVLGTLTVDDLLNDFA